MNLIETRTIRLANYELLCSASLCDNGRFEPSLVIVKCDWPRRPRVIAVRRGEHASAHGAIEAAQQQGQEWVANYGFTPRGAATDEAALLPGSPSA